MVNRVDSGPSLATARSVRKIQASVYRSTYKRKTLCPATQPLCVDVCVRAFLFFAILFFYDTEHRGGNSVAVWESVYGMGVGMLRGAVDPLLENFRI